MKAYLIALLLVSISTLVLNEQHSLAHENHQEETLDCYAVRMGLPVSYSTKWPGFEYQIYRLDA